MPDKDLELELSGMTWDDEELVQAWEVMEEIFEGLEIEDCSYD